MLIDNLCLNISKNFLKVRGWWGGGNIDGLQRFVCFMGTGQSKQESGGEERGLFSRELGLIHFGWDTSGMGCWNTQDS